MSIRQLNGLGPLRLKVVLRVRNSEFEIAEKPILVCQLAAFRPLLPCHGKGFDRKFTIILWLDLHNHRIWSALYSYKQCTINYIYAIPSYFHQCWSHFLPYFFFFGEAFLLFLSLPPLSPPCSALNCSLASFPAFLVSFLRSAFDSVASEAEPLALADGPLD